VKEHSGKKAYKQSEKQFKIRFRKYPSFFDIFKFNEANTNINSNSSNSKIVSNLAKSFKIGGFKLGNFITSFWFGVILFGMQSYFLRQNLKLTDVKFISD